MAEGRDRRKKCDTYKILGPFWAMPVANGGGPARREALGLWAPRLMEPTGSAAIYICKERAARAARSDAARDGPRRVRTSGRGEVRRSAVLLFREITIARHCGTQRPPRPRPRRRCGASNTVAFPSRRDCTKGTIAAALDLTTQQNPRQHRADRPVLGRAPRSLISGRCPAAPPLRPGGPPAPLGGGVACASRRAGSAREGA